MGCQDSKGMHRLNMTRRRRRIRSKKGSSVHMKVKKLQRLIPGGQGLNPDHLFLRTADYILYLRLQLNFLQALNSQIYKP